MPISRHNERKEQQSEQRLERERANASRRRRRTLLAFGLLAAAIAATAVALVVLLSRFPQGRRLGAASSGAASPRAPEHQQSRTQVARCAERIHRGTSMVPSAHSPGSGRALRLTSVVASRNGSWDVWRVRALHDVIAAQATVTWDASPGAVPGGGSVTTVDGF